MMTSRRRSRPSKSEREPDILDLAYLKDNPSLGGMLSHLKPELRGVFPPEHPSREVFAPGIAPLEAIAPEVTSRDVISHEVVSRDLTLPDGCSAQVIFPSDATPLRQPHKLGSPTEEAPQGLSRVLTPEVLPPEVISPDTSSRAFTSGVVTSGDLISGEATAPCATPPEDTSTEPVGPELSSGEGLSPEHLTHGVGRRRIVYVGDRAQSGHSATENAFYLWAWRHASPVDADTRRFDQKIPTIAAELNLSERSVIDLLKRLVDKRTLEPCDDWTHGRQLGRPYLIFSLRRILDRRRASGLEYAVKGKGIVLITECAMRSMQRVHGPTEELCDYGDDQPGPAN